MLTVEEIAMLEALLIRARTIKRVVEPSEQSAIHVGDLVQLRPGADAHWETSLLQVGKLRDNGSVSGAVLRPHRSGYSEAWYTYTRPEVIRVGRALFPPPRPDIRSASYLARCPRCLGRE